MSMPALRQPKTVKKKVQAKAKTQQHHQHILVKETRDFLIVNLKDGKKLVVLSDAYHGIIMSGEKFNCVFCEKEMILDVVCKERHKASQDHKKIMEFYPHVEDFKENLIRKLSGFTYYCTICNVIVQSHFLHKHITAEIHIKELEKALIRAESYMPRRQEKEEFPPLKPKIME